MAFNSPTFLIFLFVSAALYYLLPSRLQNALLLLANAVFYIWADPTYGAALALCVVAGYFFARGIEKTKSKALLAVAVILLVGTLAGTKYLGFILGIFGASALSASLSVLVPLGISFYTLQLIGYLVDLKNAKVQLERSFVRFALFITFFPQLLSGPIGRVGELIPQFKETRRFSYENVSAGLVRFLTGAFKKVALADALGLVVDGVYGDLANAAGASTATAMIFFALRLYFDFSGYTDMALGAAMVFGVRLRENFLAPYFSMGFGEFWRRWHVSLSEWFRDYLYIPLGGNRKGTVRALLNLFVVMLVSGLWHGASYGFIIWGALQGIFVIVDRYIKKPQTPSSAEKLLRRAAVFTLWTFSLLFFRLSALDACLAFTKIFNFSSYTVYDFRRALMFSDVGGFGLSSPWFALFYVLLAVGLALMLWYDSKVNAAYLAKKSLFLPTAALSSTPRWTLYWFMGLSTVYFWLLTMSGSGTRFIYAGF